MTRETEISLPPDRLLWFNDFVCLLFLSSTDKDDFLAQNEISDLQNSSVTPIGLIQDSEGQWGYLNAGSWVYVAIPDGVDGLPVDHELQYFAKLAAEGRAMWINDMELSAEERRRVSATSD